MSSFGETDIIHFIPKWPGLQRALSVLVGPEVSGEQTMNGNMAACL